MAMSTTTIPAGFTQEQFIQALHDTIDAAWGAPALYNYNSSWDDYGYREYPSLETVKVFLYRSSTITLRCQIASDATYTGGTVSVKNPKNGSSASLPANGSDVNLYAVSTPSYRVAGYGSIFWGMGFINAPPLFWGAKPRASIFDFDTRSFNLLNYENPWGTYDHSTFVGSGGNGDAYTELDAVGYSPPNQLDTRTGKWQLLASEPVNNYYAPCGFSPEGIAICKSFSAVASGTTFDAGERGYWFKPRSSSYWCFKLDAPLFGVTPVAATVYDNLLPEDLGLPSGPPLEPPTMGQLHVTAPGIPAPASHTFTPEEP